MKTHLLAFLVPAAAASYIMEDAARAIATLQSRDGICGGLSNLAQCGGAFPKDFCCTTGSTCLGFNDNNGVICCPAGQQCSTILPVPCTLDLFNATLNPTNPVHLNSPSSNLSACNGNCCPPGFACSNGICILGGSNTTAPTAAAATGGAASLPTVSTATPTTSISQASASSIPAPSTSTNDIAANPSCNAFPATAVVTGFFPGMLAGALLAFLLSLCFGRHSKTNGSKHLASETSSAIGPVRAHVSDPIYIENGGARTDFLRRNTKARRLNETPSMSETMSTPLTRVRSLFSRTPTLRNRGLGVSNAGTGDAEGGTSVSSPRTPERNLKKEPSMESITIWSPEAVRGVSGVSRNTTFGDVMRAFAAAGSDHISTSAVPPVPDPSAYMGSPGRVDPRSRGVDGGSLR